ncbi:HlyD family secretion protein [Rhizobiaceae bacterium BDR2-2]|uniref:HlyD family secretion protein n=1 Tax=Ectorhizobium quercum TaxID=2965071 RepID=A0AAE3MYY7_9HYPH|nr:HlyD family secretion protein [Ectorhizobium quercum]MCX8996886.1 HlyD family secretion protein [Ectorhizobium quercum]
MTDVAERVAPDANDTVVGKQTADVAKPAAPPAAPASAPARARKRPNPALVLVVLALAGAGGWYAYDWWKDGRFLVSTDDAYVAGDIAVIAPKVSGYVAKVDATENQFVKAGDPLVTLDDGDYRLAVREAEAAIATEKLALERIDAQIVGAKASLAQASAQKLALDAAVRGALINRDRAESLQAKDVGTTASRDNARIAFDQAKANLAAGEAAVSAADANIRLLETQRKEAESTLVTLNISLEKANRDLEFTVLRAPYDGIAGNFAVQTGDYVAAGKRLAALVPTDALYIDANFKETQLERIAPGAKVRIHVDAAGDREFEGTVESIAPASGSVFSMLPAENATGNFTKIVQRVPVRIALPKEALGEGWLRAGLSTVVDVDIRTAPSKVAAAN